MIIPQGVKQRDLFRVLLLTALFLFTLKCFSLLLRQHIALIQHPYQVELNEGSSLNLAKAMAEGQNPYILENQPWLYDNFGIMYPLVSWPFTRLFGMNLFSMRLTSALAIGLCMILVFLALFKSKVGWVMSFTGSVIFYGCVLYYVSPICRADSLAMLFLMLSVIVPVISRFHGKGLFLAGVFSILSFYTKQYGILGFPIILMYVFLFVSMRRALVQALSFFLLLALSMWLMAKAFPCYFYNTTASMAFANNNNFIYSWMQMEGFFGRYLTGLSLSAVLSAGVWLYLSIKNNRLKEWKGNSLNFRKFSLGLLSAQPNPYAFGFVIFFFLLLFKLGGNEGTFMTYHFQLMAFLWIIAVVFYASKWPQLLILHVPLLAFATYTITTLNTSTGMFKPENSGAWEEAIALIRNHKNVLNDQSLTAEMVYAGKRTFNTGLNAYFFRSTVNEAFNARFPFTQKLIEKGDAFKDTVRSTIRDKKFDLLLLSRPNWIVSGFPVEKYYAIHDSLRLNMYQSYEDLTVYVWKPLPDSSRVGE